MGGHAIAESHNRKPVSLRFLFHALESCSPVRAEKLKLPVSIQSYFSYSTLFCLLRTELITVSKLVGAG